MTRLSPRRIVLLTNGTRGDIQPFVALAAALEERGHKTHLGVPPNLIEFVTRCGLSCSPLAGDSREILESEKGRQWLSSGNMRAFFAAMADINNALGDESNRRVLEACEGADLVITNVLMEDWAAAVCDARKIPLVLAYTMPVLPTSEMPSFLVSTGWVPFGALRRLTHSLALKEMWKSHASITNALRTQLGIAPSPTATAVRAARDRRLALHLWSPRVLARCTDWHDEAVVTGFLRLPAALRTRLGESTPPRALVDWLRAGDAPVFLGFGSMPVLDHGKTLQMAVDVAQQLGVRVLVGAGWNDVADVAKALPPNVRLVDQIDHTWLFPQCSGLVHHGGAGTTMTGLEAGIPAMVCSVFADQPFWGSRIEKLGVGVHVPYAKLNPARLKAGIEAIRTPERRTRATEVAAALREEDGLANAVRAFETHMGALVS